MEKLFPRIKNYNVSVKEVDGKVIFLRKLVRGSSEHSFGIHVAKLAGLPNKVVNRANEILEQLEVGNSKSPITDGSKPAKKKPEAVQLSLFQLDDPILEAVRDEINHLDINNLTPIEALNKLNEIKKIVGGK